MVIAFIIGIVSAVFAYSLFFEEELLFLFFPGAIFGIFVALYFFLAFNNNPVLIRAWKLAIFVGISSLSFFLATLLSSNIVSEIDLGLPEEGLFMQAILFGLAGAIGLIVLLVPFHLLFTRFSMHQAVIMLCFGIFTPILSVVFSAMIENICDNSFSSLFRNDCNAYNHLPSFISMILFQPTILVLFSYFYMKNTIART